MQESDLATLRKEVRHQGQAFVRETFHALFAHDTPITGKMARLLIAEYHVQAIATAVLSFCEEKDTQTAQAVLGYLSRTLELISPSDNNDQTRH